MYFRPYPNAKDYLFRPYPKTIYLVPTQRLFISSLPKDYLFRPYPIHAFTVAVKSCPSCLTTPSFIIYLFKCCWTCARAELFYVDIPMTTPTLEMVVVLQSVTSLPYAVFAKAANELSWPSVQLVTSPTASTEDLCVQTYLQLFLDID
jgi:hypothetical protein